MDALAPLRRRGRERYLNLNPMTFGAGPGKALEIVCFGAHCDDIEIGCGGTILRMAGERRVNVTWVSLSSDPRRAAEARRSAASFLRKASSQRLLIGVFRDGFLPGQWTEVKTYFERLKDTVAPDLIFTHDRNDRHQDHRIVSELTWNTFRNHTILEYEIPKYDGELSPPNVYVPVSRAVAERKAATVLRAYRSQADKQWFTADTMLGLMRLRGVESNAPGGYAEGFIARKLVI